MNTPTVDTFPIIVRTATVPHHYLAKQQCWTVSLLAAKTFDSGFGQLSGWLILGSQILNRYLKIKYFLKVHRFSITDLLLFLLTAFSWLLFLLFWFRHFWHRLQNLNWSHWKLMNHDYRFLPAWTFLASSSWKIFRVLFWKVAHWFKREETFVHHNIIHSFSQILSTINPDKQWVCLHLKGNTIVSNLAPRMAIEGILKICILCFQKVEVELRKFHFHCSFSI